MSLKINIPDKNEYDDKAAAFAQSKQGIRLNNKYRAKPYQDRFKWLMIVAFVASILCNIYNAMSASTYLFSYLYGLTAGLKYSFWPVVVVTVILLALVEVVQRWLPTMIISDCFQYGFKTNMIGMICIIVLVSGFSVSMSYLGSFDLSEKMAAEPVYVEPELKDLDKIRSIHSKEISAAKSEARDFKNANSYKGKLDYNRGRQYSKKLDHIAALRKDMQAALNDAKKDNAGLIAESKAAFNVAIVERSENVTYYGSGMAKGTIVSICLLMLCLWFLEYYDYRTATQYADPIDTKAVFNAPDKQIIGFNTETAKTAAKQAYTTVNTNKQTVTHEGKQYDKGTVQNYCNVYRKRADKYNEQGKTGLYESNNDKAIFWNAKLKEFK